MSAGRGPGPAGDVPPQALADLLSLVLDDAVIPAPVIATWTPRDRDDAERWAAAEHLRASDHPVRTSAAPDLVTRTAGICGSRALAQLAVEEWMQAKEQMEEGAFDSWDEMADVLARAGQDAVTGLLVLLGGQGDPARVIAREQAWQGRAREILASSPGGMTVADLVMLLGRDCPLAGDLDDWLVQGNRTGLLDNPVPRFWRMRKTAG